MCLKCKLLSLYSTRARKLYDYIEIHSIHTYRTSLQLKVIFFMMILKAVNETYPDLAKFVHIVTIAFPTFIISSIAGFVLPS